MRSIPLFYMFLTRWYYTSIHSKVNAFTCKLASLQVMITAATCQTSTNEKIRLKSASTAEKM
jgi:hypothetical protein